MTTLLGYACILGYIFLMIFALGPVIQRLSDLEVSRKAIHISLFAVWLLIDLFFRDSIHQIIVPVLFILFNSLSRRFRIFKSVEREQDDHPGTVYFAVAVTLILTLAYFVPSFYYPSGVAVFCLTFGDGFAALVGHLVPSRKLYENKTAAGFLAGFAASALSLQVFCRVYPVPLSLWQLLSVALVGAVFELTGRGLDNFTIVFSTLLLSWLYLFADQGSLLPSVAVALAVFALVFFSRAITYYGALLALCMVVIFSFCGGGYGLGFLLGTYFTIFLISLFKKKVLRLPGKERARDLRQIAINGGLGTLLMLLYGLGCGFWCLEAAVVAVGGCFVDSLSSDLGILSPRPPYDFFRRQRVEPGLSGGMGLLGTLAAALGAGAIALSMGLCFPIGPGRALGIGGLIFAQTLLDSAMGSLIQAKYRCPDCGTLSEHRIHCGREGRLVSGLGRVDNNMVNLLSSLAITLAAILVLK